MNYDLGHLVVGNTVIGRSFGRQWSKEYKLPRGIHMKNEAVLALLYIDQFYVGLIASQASIVVRAVNCHPGGPSSIPCPASSFFLKNLFVFLQRTAVIARFRGEKTPNLRVNTPCKLQYIL